MDTKDLVPWNWFKKANLPVSSIFNEDNNLLTNSSRSLNPIFEDFVEDFGGFETFLPTFLKNNINNNIKILPRMDISDTENEYIVETDLPGIKEADVDISVSKDGIMTIHGKRENKAEEKNRNYYRVERCYGSFARTIVLPENSDRDKIQANFKDGILTLRIPKKEPNIGEVKKIAVNTK
jgi:HSP20 family protein